MGSTGSGRFTDYSGAKKPEAPGSGAAGGGGSSGVDKCQQAFECVLEEVAQCTYYMQTGGAVPAPGTVLNVMHRGRMFAVDSSGMTVGALPTKFNYLAACIADGTNYVGVVKSSSATPVPTVAVDFTPH